MTFEKYLDDTCRESRSECIFFVWYTYEIGFFFEYENGASN